MFENFEQYKSKRDSLLAEAEKMLNKADKAGYEAKVKEVEELDKNFENFRAEQANLNALKDKGVKAPEALGNMTSGERVGSAKSQENIYREAFYNNLRGIKLSAEQAKVFANVNGFENLFTTTTEAAALPVQTLDKIWDLCEEQHSILEDIDLRRTGVAIKVVVRESITSGKASKKAKSAEGQADAVLVDVKKPVELNGHDFTATVELSYAAAKMSIDALEAFIVKDIADQIGGEMATDTVTTIETALPTSNKASAAGDVYTYEEVANIFSKCKRCTGLKVYVSNTTLYSKLVSMVDKNGRPIFQPNAQDGAKGTLIGAQVRLESAVADGKLLVGDPKKVIGNVVQDITLETDKDIKRHVYVYSGYARYESALIDKESFAELTATATNAAAATE